MGKKEEIMSRTEEWMRSKSCDLDLEEKTKTQLLDRLEKRLKEKFIRKRKNSVQHIKNDLGNFDVLNKHITKDIRYFKCH